MVNSCHRLILGQPSVVGNDLACSGLGSSRRNPVFLARSSSFWFYYSADESKYPAAAYTQVQLLPQIYPAQFLRIISSFNCRRRTRSDSINVIRRVVKKYSSDFTAPYLLHWNAIFMRTFCSFIWQLSEKVASLINNEQTYINVRGRIVKCRWRRESILHHRKVVSLITITDWTAVRFCHYFLP